jgi:hypothetical protein
MNWVWNGWNNEATNHDAWTGDGWNGYWNGKQMPAPAPIGMGKPTGSPSAITGSPSARKLTNIPSELPSPEPSDLPSSPPSVFPSNFPSTSAPPSSLPTPILPVFCSDGCDTLSCRCMEEAFGNPALCVSEIDSSCKTDDFRGCLPEDQWSSAQIYCRFSACIVGDEMSEESCSCDLHLTNCFADSTASEGSCDIAQCCFYQADDEGRRQCLPVFPTAAPTDEPSDAPSTPPS